MIPNFREWCKANKLELPVDENTKRSGIRPQYPDGYVRSQYPADSYFMPYSATAALDLKNASSIKSKAPSNEAP